jgi:D-erythrulose 1-phosphate 3-epimerase
MTTFRLGINNCFAVKRWPEPKQWAAIVRDRLDLDLVQHSLDLVELSAPAHRLQAEAERVRKACATRGLELHSTFTGLVAYSSNLLLDPQPARRKAAEAWYRRAIEFSAAAGAKGTGGHVGAYSTTDWHDAPRRRKLDAEFHAALLRLSGLSKRAGLRVLYVENLAATREPSTMADVTRLLTHGDARHVPLELCLDVGHMCTPGTHGAERDPYAWLRHFSPRAVHVQQSDANGDHHWPFTTEFNRLGRIDAKRVIDILSQSGVPEVALILEIIPPFEADDEMVLDDLSASVRHWRRALD